MNQSINIDPEENVDPIEKYGIDLTKLAKEGKIDPVIGRCAASDQFGSFDLNK